MGADQTSNLTGLFEAEETSLNVLDVSPTWFEREPNSYADFGGNFAMTQRQPIVRDRQHTKGEVSDNNPTVSYNEDLTPTNMVRPAQGFFFADAHQKPTTRPLNSAATVITSVDGAAEAYKAAAGLDIFKAGHIVLAEGFADPANNGIEIVSAATATTLTVGNNLNADAGPAPTAMLTAVGFMFAAGIAGIVVTASRVRLTSSVTDLTTLGLNLGEYIFVGGDDTVTRFADTGANAPFYGRVAAIAAGYIELDKTTGTQATNAGAGKTIQIFFGSFLRNESDPALIKRRSYTFERQYGYGVDMEADYVFGAVSNQMTITVPTPGANAKVTVDLAYVACQSTERTKAEDLISDVGTKVAAFGEACFKPGLDVYRHRLAVIDETTLNPTGLVAYNSEATVVINNNASGNKAIETFGNSGINIGDFTITGSVNAYWMGVDATRAVRQGKDCTWDLILTKNKKAVIFDIASLGLGNGRATVAANTSVKLPLDTAAGKGKFGYTLAATFLRYVPAAGMAQ